MSKLNIILAGIAMTMALASCEQNLETYNTEDCHLNFLYYDYYGTTLYDSQQIDVYLDDDYNVSNFSFAYAGEAQRDTLWFKVGTMGFLSNEDRPIALQQIAVSDTVNNAEPGVHYVAFDDPALIPLYQVPAGQDSVSIPVVLLRDPSLDEKTVVLSFTFADNGYFSPGYELMSTRTIFFTAKPVEPSNWSDAMFGDWGPLKHQLFMEWTGERWDVDYINSLYDDATYPEYINTWLHNKLEEENTKREAAGLGKYEEEDGTEIEYHYTEVDFKSKYYEKSNIFFRLHSNACFKHGSLF